MLIEHGGAFQGIKTFYHGVCHGDAPLLFGYQPIYPFITIFGFKPGTNTKLKLARSDMVFKHGSLGMRVKGIPGVSECKRSFANVSRYGAVSLINFVGQLLVA